MMLFDLNMLFFLVYIYIYIYIFENRGEVTYWWVKELWQAK
jgi:hypothetical protein